MAIRQRDVRITQRRYDIGGDGGPPDDVPIGELIKRVGNDAGTLVKQEIALAKLELRESFKSLAKDAGKLGAAAGLAFLGALAVLAFAIIGLGDLLNNYWLSSLVIGLVLLVAAWLTARAARHHMKQNSLAPEETVETLREYQRWAKHEVQEFKQSIKR